ncbi:MAG: T9SS type A sorting domain-containing protein [Ferruginibacter sp.]
MIQKITVYTDIEATDINYYRLELVDVSGYTKQSPVVLVKNTNITAQRVSVENTPFTNYINIRFDKVPKGKTTLRLIDLSGRLINVTEKVNLASSLIHFDSFNQSLSKGVYLLQIESEGKQYNIKVLKIDTY